MKPTYFATPAELRAWFEKHHETAAELHLGYFKKSSGKPSVTWPESVDQALCFGWIDGVRKGLDDARYMIRFTPRKPTSIWSAVNTRRVKELEAAGLMRPAGLRAFALRDEKRTAIYAYEREVASLPPDYTERLKSNRAAFEFYQEQPLGYRRISAYWVTTAKQEATRDRRFGLLLEHCARGRRIPQLLSPAAKKRLPR